VGPTPSRWESGGAQGGSSWVAGTATNQLGGPSGGGGGGANYGAAGGTGVVMILIN
jgi:hypothetical protein